jgi:hypothetical protein
MINNITNHNYSFVKPKHYKHIHDNRSVNFTGYFQFPPPIKLYRNDLIEVHMYC